MLFISKLIFWSKKYVFYKILYVINVISLGIIITSLVFHFKNGYEKQNKDGPEEDEKVNEKRKTYLEIEIAFDILSIPLLILIEYLIFKSLKFVEKMKNIDKESDDGGDKVDTVDENGNKKRKDSGIISKVELNVIKNNHHQSHLPSMSPIPEDIHENDNYDKRQRRHTSSDIKNVIDENNNQRKISAKW